MTYGVPYQGSKSRIAHDLIKALPSGKRFVDLFGGGGAMTHAACLSGKYDEVLYNDTQSNLIVLLKDAIAGKYNYSCFTPEFITRDEFDKRKDEDAYIKYIWSFSNNGRDYLYSHDIEDGKRSVHNYVVFGIKDKFLKQNFPTIELMCEGIRKRRAEWSRKLKAMMGESGTESTSPLELHEHLVRLERMQQLSQIERLQYLERRGVVQFSNMDYKDYEYREGDIVYCDPPYENAREYIGDFDSAGFYDWVYSRPYTVYFSSYDNISDKRFTPIWTTTKRNLMNGSMGNVDIRIEALYCNKPGAYIKKEEQLNFFWD